MLDKTIAYNLDFLYPTRDKTVGQCLSENGEFSRVLLDIFLEMSAGSGSFTMIDVGANIGSISLPFAQNRPDWKVIAIEAHRGLSGILHANALNNKLYNVEVINAAAGPSRGIVDFPATSLLTEMNFGNVGFDDKLAPTTPTAMLTLDEVAPVDTRLIKIDVENFEPQVLLGAQKLLRDHQTAWIVEATINFPETTLQTVRIFLDAGYSVYWFFVPFATPISAKKRPTNAGTGDANILALPAGFENIWNLPKITVPTDARPGNQAAYPYLAKYGYK
jgi:FkbM family methyltransferase